MGDKREVVKDQKNIKILENVESYNCPRLEWTWNIKDVPN